MLLIFSIKEVDSFRLTHAILLRKNAAFITSKLILKAETIPTEGNAPARINTLVDVSSEKVVHQISINSGEKAVICRCWESTKFPYCDGAHVQHNKATGDNVGPAIVTAVAK